MSTCVFTFVNTSYPSFYNTYVYTPNGTTPYSAKCWALFR